MAFTRSRLIAGIRKYWFFKGASVLSPIGRSATNVRTRTYAHGGVYTSDLQNGELLMNARSAMTRPLLPRSGNETRKFSIILVAPASA